MSIQTIAYIWHENMLGYYFVRGHYLFREANSFPKAQLEENCELQGTDNAQGQISELILAPMGAFFLNMQSFEMWGYLTIIHQSEVGWRWIFTEPRIGEFNIHR